MSENRQDPISLSFAFVTGLGFILWIIGFYLAAVDAATDETLGLTFLLGAALIIAGLAGWLFLRRPFLNFDDINQPLDADGH